MVLQLTDSVLWVGVIVGIRAVPTTLLALFGGAVTDRLDRRAILVVTRSAMAALGLLTGFLVSAGLIEAWHLLLIGVAAGAALAFSGPAWRAMVVDLVGRERALTGNALNEVAGSVGEILGPAIAGFLIAWTDVAVVYYLAGAIYVASVMLTLRMRHRTQPSARPKRSILDDVRDGLAYARRTPGIPAMLAIASTTIFVVALIPLLPVYARDVLDVGSSGFGIMASALGVGFLVGSILISMAGDIPRKAVVLLIAGAFWDGPMVAFAFSRIFVLSVALVFVMGIGGAVWVNLTLTLLQTFSNDEMRGRVMSLYMIATQAAPLGMILAGALAAAVSNEFALVFGAILATPVGVVVFLRSPALRRT